MTRKDEFLNYVLDQMAFIRGLNARTMFGGYGLYQDELIFAIIINDMLYLKADDATQSEFEAKGLMPFSYASRGRTVTMQYYEAPTEVFENIDEMRYWTYKAQDAALASNAKKGNTAKRRPDKA